MISTTGTPQLVLETHSAVLDFGYLYQLFAYIYIMNQSDVSIIVGEKNLQVLLVLCTLHRNSPKHRPQRSSHLPNNSTLRGSQSPGPPGWCTKETHIPTWDSKHGPENRLGNVGKGHLGLGSLEWWPSLTSQWWAITCNSLASFLVPMQFIVYTKLVSNFFWHCGHFWKVTLKLGLIGRVWRHSLLLPF